MSANKPFDDLMKLVGDSGKFQRNFNYIFNVGLIICASMAYMNIILIMNVPEHWCHVPGRELTNYTVEEWMNITLPKDIDNRGSISYSKCKMYNITQYDIYNGQLPTNLTETTYCSFGYDYDRRYYLETVVTQENWVCDRDFYVANTFVFNRIGEIVGTFVFGQLGDTLGRRFVFYLSLFTVIVGRILVILTTKHFFWFSVTAVIGSLTSNSIFLAPLIIALEISKPDDRSKIAMFQSFGWTFGICIMPLVFWYTGYWVWFLLLTTLPGLLFFCFPKYMIESPRWLANKNKYKSCAQQLAKIAKVNKFKEHLDEKLIEEKLTRKQNTEQVYGVMSLFSNWRLAKNTSLMIIIWGAAATSYFVLVLNASRMDGNPHLNFLWQSAIELPAYLLGQRLSDSLGRRFTNVLCFVCACVSSFLQIFIVSDADNENIASIISIFIKFAISITFLVVNLQATEIYPTCLRQTGMAVGGIVANAFGILGPIIVHLGTKYDIRYPYIILTVLSLLAAVSGLFLPETLHAKLPETLAEAQKFGASQKFWGIPKQVKEDKNEDDDVMEKLNPIQHH